LFIMVYFNLNILLLYYYYNIIIIYIKIEKKKLS